MTCSRTQVPVIFGDDTNAGTVFTPKGTSSQSQSNAFLRSQFPELTSDQLSRISQLYPNEGPDFENAGVFWRQVSNAYGDLVSLIVSIGPSPHADKMTAIYVPNS